jgi:hypothetical protein
VVPYASLDLLYKNLHGWLAFGEPKEPSRNCPVLALRGLLDRHLQDWRRVQCEGRLALAAVHAAALSP